MDTFYPKYQIYLANEVEYINISVSCNFWLKETGMSSNCILIPALSVFSSSLTQVLAVVKGFDTACLYTKYRQYDWMVTC